MRRIIALVLVGIIVLALAEGCGSGQGASQAGQPTAQPTTVPPEPTSASSVLGSPPSSMPTAVPTSPALDVPPPMPTPPPQAPPVAPPQRIQIPAVGVDAGFEYLGLTKDNAMDAPKDPDKVGWYKLGPVPGEQGNAIVAGHVDWGGKTRVFWPLKNLKAGDTVIVTDTDGKKHEFAVQWSKWYGATASVNEVYQQGDQTELTMITCGGEFDHATKQYLSRFVVRAKLR